MGVNGPNNQTLYIGCDKLCVDAQIRFFLGVEMLFIFSKQTPQKWRKNGPKPSFLMKGEC